MLFHLNKYSLLSHAISQTTIGSYFATIWMIQYGLKLSFTTDQWKNVYSIELSYSFRNAFSMQTHFRQETTFKKEESQFSMFFSTIE